MARSPFVAGIRDCIPLAIPTVPFGLVLGVLIANSTVNNMVGWLATPVIYGGAAQLTVISVLAAGSAPLAALVGGMVVSSRHLLYSAALAPSFADQPRWFRWLGPYTLVDQVFALAQRFEQSEPTRASPPTDPAAFRHYYLGASLVMWLPWQVWVMIGILAGAQLPNSWQLDFAVPVLFLGLAVLGIKGRPGVKAAVVAFLVAAALGSLPNQGGLLIGALCGVAVSALDGGQR